MINKQITPLLPSNWPYMPRIIPEHYEYHNNIKLPGLQGLWNLEITPGLKFCNSIDTVETSFGRGGLFRLGSIVLRPYKRGGLIKHINKSTYYGIKRFRNEFYLHHALWKSGFPTVEPLGWAYKHSSFGNNGVLLTRLTEGIPWPYSWNISPNIVSQLKTMLNALCSWKIHAPDLNATNILISPQGKLIALDWDKSNWSNSENLIDSYRKRLIRSIKKLGAKKTFLIQIDHALKNND